MVQRGGEDVVVEDAGNATPGEKGSEDGDSESSPGLYEAPKESLALTATGVW